MKRSALASLAILKVNFETLGRDYIDSFVPFIAESLRTAPDDAVSLPALQVALKDAFGLLLPLNPLRQALQRAAKAGFVRREAGVFYRDQAACSKTAFSTTQASVTNTQARVIAALKRFAVEKSATDWSDTAAEDALLSFVGDTGLDVLYATAEQTVLPQASAKGTDAFVVASFVRHCQQADPALLRDFETIVKGALLANALYVPDHGKFSQRFRNTKIYLDTTFLIFGLGYAGSDRQGPCLELIELLKQYEAQLRCFQHTLDEIRGVLDACAARIRRGQLRDAFGPTIEYFITQGLNSTDVDLLAARVPQRLALHGITVEDKPPYDEQLFVIDETGLEAHLQKNVGYHNRHALQHDVDCMSAIARVRRGRDSFSVETCGALFVTTNAELARATRSFFQAEAPPGAIALCISDYALGNLLWLKNPTRAPDLPRRRLIADAYAALQPPEQLWKAYLAEIARMEERGDVGPEDYLLLRHSVSAKSALMDITKGDASVFTQGTVAEVLEVAKRTVRADLQEELAKERAERIASEARIADREAREAERSAHIQERASRWARRGANALFHVAMLILAVATIYTFPWQLPALRGAWLRYGLGLAQAALLAYAVASMGWGTTIQQLSQKVQSRLATVIERRIRALTDSTGGEGAV
jgi:hypothetical protein